MYGDLQTNRGITNTMILIHTETFKVCSTSFKIDKRMIQPCWAVQPKTDWTWLDCSDTKLRSGVWRKFDAIWTSPNILPSSSPSMCASSIRKWRSHCWKQVGLRQECPPPPQRETTHSITVEPFLIIFEITSRFGSQKVRVLRLGVLLGIKLILICFAESLDSMTMTEYAWMVMTGRAREWALFEFILTPSLRFHLHTYSFIDAKKCSLSESTEEYFQKEQVSARGSKTLMREMKLGWL